MICAYIAQRFNFWGIRNDLLRCTSVVDLYSAYRIPIGLVEILIVAEDRRNYFHFGIDPIGILRSVCVYLRTAEIQGASTIEQQFVRVVTGRYEKNISRKVKEQLLAIALCHQRNKFQIASAYLCIAHYGYRLKGISGLHVVCGQSLSNSSQCAMREAIARLKYPEPSTLSVAWIHRIKLRSVYIANRMSKHRLGTDDLPGKIENTSPKRSSFQNMCHFSN